ncbi:PilT protein domain protein [Oceanithermus profundus DSM 14977]|uniref:PilT protein domain protein n=1 Tax=Oceanithermus profundus (strain DSM 14977 / NBRC 100410 / VKM B-2274 / 506) TaxID=670487 RepID=E4U977_OCEP5|nr:putative toxin-antitoxin system toxin component, PIN family [Oceanithermus profundus]ADR36906.1 PilT protein domain protein [Oceanithermus profundus DSM 14977]
MIRLVVDPGVLIAAVLSAAGAPAELLRYWLDGAVEIVVSEKLLNELDTVLQRPKFRSYLSVAEAKRYVALLRRWAEVASDVESGEAFTTDPKDDYLVALALSSRADLLVSGDKHLTGIEHPRVPVLTPRQAVGLLKELDRKKGES